jgi:hypothetical protein
MTTSADKRREIDRIETKAVETVMMHICQIFDGIRAQLLEEKRKLGYTQKFFVNGTVERECYGLVESIKASLADDLPVDPTNAVENEDICFDLLDEDAIVEVGQRVRKIVRELLGVFDEKE